MPKRGPPDPTSVEGTHRPKKQRTSISSGNPRTTPNIRANRKGFVVGPNNLPDGKYRRKVQKIKKTLIHRAKLRKNLDKIKRKEGLGTHITKDDAPTNTDDDEAAARARRRMERAMQSDDEDDDEASDIAEGVSEASIDPGADVTARNGDEVVSSADDDSNDDTPGGNDRHTHPSRKQNTRRPKLSRYTHEIQKSRKTQEAKAERDRIARMKAAAAEKRERERKARNKAMGGGKTAKTSTGQMKLGRQSKGLLEKVQQLMKA
ncbi:hypothetical protein TWF696_009932 [Orbilia brochopaga]|uniref:rRNA-processing protein FYV7 n=1 Tax=Orbilia brochopaga TaxID=3140254 RepID=A0AAV9UQL3_9PEZI